jgi:hypothetical protein
LDIKGQHLPLLFRFPLWVLWAFSSKVKGGLGKLGMSGMGREEIAMEGNVLRILIVEDTPQRQEILRNLYKVHAWVMVHTVDRAKGLIEAYDFGLISLDYGLGGEKRGDEIASYISQFRNAGSKVIVHSMNAQGAKRILEILPRSEHVPLSKMTKDNSTFKRIQEKLSRGAEINWHYVFGAESGKKR